MLSIGETNTTYNEHCLPMVGRRRLAVCTYFPNTIVPCPGLAVFAGDGTLRGFFRALDAALSKERYDLIHAHTPHVAFLLLTASAVVRDLCRCAILTVHGTYRDYKLRNRLLLLAAFAGMRRVVCCGEASRASFPRSFTRLAGSRLCAVPNGVDVERVDRVAAATRTSRSARDPFRVVTACRMVALKDPLTVVSAFARACEDDSHLACLGDGPMYPALLRQAAESRISGRLTAPGLVSRDSVLHHLLGADLFVSASLGEGLPIAVLEAMACRCPVVLSDIPPHREIANGTDWIPLVPPRDDFGLARAIYRFRTMAPAERVRIGDACRRHVEQRFSLRAMHEGYEAVYREVAGRRGVAAAC